MAELPIGAVVAIDVVAWASLSAVVGFTASKLPDAVFARETALTRIRPFEQGGRRWERWLRVRRWKDHLPEAGGFFGGVSKRHLAGRHAVAQQLIETRRAEWAHVALLAVAPAFALGNPPALAAAMVGYAVVANVPCIVIVRVNRARFLRVQARLERRPAATPA